MLWVLLIVLVLLTALILESGLLAFAMYVLLGVVLSSRYLARTWVNHLRAKRTCPTEPLEAGSSVEVKVRLENTGTLPVAWVLLEDLLPEYALRQRPPRLRLKGKRLKLAALRAGNSVTLKYKITFQRRGYYQIGPVLLETGDLFGLHRRHRLLTQPAFVLVYPKVLPLPKYDFASERPIGEVHLANRLFEDPTRNAGVRPYQVGDPLQRIHWRATARTGELHSRVYEPTSLAGATILLDFDQAGYPSFGEPHRSDLAVTLAVSLAYEVTMLNQQIGLASNGRDAADRVRLTGRERLGEEAASGEDFESRDQARELVRMDEENARLRPLQVETRRGIEQFQRIREALARVELTDGLSFPGLVIEVTPRIPRDATVIAILPWVPMETAVALGSLRRQGFAVTAILVGLGDDDRAIGHGRLAAEAVRDVRYVNQEADLDLLGQNTFSPGAVPYAVDYALS